MRQHYKIGVSGPFTGKRKAYGDLILEGTIAVKKEFSFDEEIEFIFLDDKAEVNFALEAANCFIENSVNAVIGHFNSSCAIEVAKIYHENRITFIAPASTAVNIPYENEGYVYRTCPTDLEQVELILEKCESTSIQKLGILSDDSPYGNELLRLTKEYSKSIELEILTDFEIGPDLDAIWIVGKHFFCIEAGEKLFQMNEKRIPLLFCDDCFINEFIEHFNSDLSTLYLVGLHDSNYGELFKESLRALIQHLTENKMLEFKKGRWKLYNLEEIRNGKNV